MGKLKPCAAQVSAVVMANYLCNDLGMDTIACGNLFALVMDLYDLGIVNKDQD